MTHFDKFPASMPMEEIGCVVSYLKGGTEHDKRCVAGCCWWIAGYGISFLPSGEMHATKDMAEPDEAVLLTHLEAMQGEGMRAIPWALILPLVLKLAEKLLERL